MACRVQQVGPGRGGVRARLGDRWWQPRGRDRGQQPGTCLGERQADQLIHSSPLRRRQTAAPNGSPPPSICSSRSSIAWEDTTASRPASSTGCRRRDHAGPAPLELPGDRGRPQDARRRPAITTPPGREPGVGLTTERAGVTPFCCAQLSWRRCGTRVRLSLMMSAARPTTADRSPELPRYCFGLKSHPPEKSLRQPGLVQPRRPGRSSPAGCSQSGRKLRFDPPCFRAGSNPVASRRSSHERRNMLPGFSGAVGALGGAPCSQPWSASGSRNSKIAP